MKFVGGNDLIFTLILVILLAFIIMLYNQVSFFFTPLFVFLSNSVAPFIVALLFYYIFNPLIDFLESHKIKRLYGVALLYLFIVILIVIGVSSFYPVLADQLTNFVDNFPAFINSINESFSLWSENLPLSGMSEGFINQGQDFVANIPDNIEQYLTEGITGLSKVISNLTNVIVTTVTAPIVLFFLLKDGKQFFEIILSITPPKWRDDLIELSSQVNAQVGSYVKGQLIIASSLAVMMLIGFTIIGLDYNGVLAIIGGLHQSFPI